MDRLIGIVSGTPLWVWPLLAALLWLGIRAGQTRIVSVRQMIILPSAIFAMSVSTLLTAAPGFTIVLIWGSGLLCGTLLGWFANRDAGVRVDRANRRLLIPGEWKTLGLILLIFAIRYAFGYKSATDPDFVAQPAVIYSYMGLSGALSGVFIGWRLHTF
ncbi:MAG: hypothetical protein GKS00_17260 [Alphaproteobacteria bacterium]|nr:hypothetical protein [Alphaproteobacteria bacterium]